MLAHASRLALFTALVGIYLVATADSHSQEVVPPPAPAEVPQGVEVLARGPVHEAFATPSSEARPTQPVAKKPPAPLEELPPEEKPEGDVVWVRGYYAYDDDRQDYLWVSGCWRIKPAGKEWVPGYWREVGEQWQWVPGFWTVVHADQPAQVTYHPEPPAPPQVAAPAAPPPDMFYVPGYWMWMGDHYAWRAGYWTRVRPGYVYVASHYRWTPHGYVFVPGYWDLAVGQRGLLYAPVAVNPAVVGATFVYTPSYAVTDTIMLDALFVRPATCHYYFGDYYGPRYVTLGFEPCVVYSRRYYEPIVVYRRWEYRDNPRWIDIQVNLYHDRSAGRAPVPQRTLVQQHTVINNITVNNVTVNNIQKTQVLAPARTVLAARGQNTVPLSPAARAQVHTTSAATQQALAAERRKLEPPGAHAAPPAQARVSTLSAPTAGALHPAAPPAPAGAVHPNMPMHPPAAGAPPHPLPPQAQPPRPVQRPKDDHKKKAL